MMIDFKGKNCLALQDKIKDAGLWLAEVDGVWESSDDVVVQQIIDGFTLETLKQSVTLNIESLATAKRNKIISPYSPGEMASWAIKREEALKYQQSGLSQDAPNLSNEASYRGIPLQDLVVKVLNDAARFSAIESAIAGTSGRHRDSVKSLQSIEDVMSYDYSAGWPV